MAIYYFDMQRVKRSEGRSSVEMAAYQAREKMEDLRTGINYNSQDKDDILAKGIYAPDNAPDYFYNRAELWNANEASFKRNDSCTAKTIIAALPREFSLEQSTELLKKYIANNFVAAGMVADWAIHENIAEDGEPNPHVHILLTKKDIVGDGFGKVNREWDKKEKLLEWRKSWADDINDMADRDGLEFTVSEKSYEEQGLDIKPQQHLGAEFHSMEKKGIKTRIGDFNRDVIQRNKAVKMAKQGVTALFGSPMAAWKFIKHSAQEKARKPYLNQQQDEPLLEQGFTHEKMIQENEIEPEPPDKGFTQ